MDIDTYSKDAMHIALCVNDSWAEHVAPLVYSLSVSNPQDSFVIHLVYREISEKKLATIQQLDSLLTNIGIDLCPIEDGVLSQISVEGYHLPIETYFRLLLPELLPTVNRILYLDVDTMVCSSLAELWEIDLGQSCIGAVLDLDVHTVLSWHLDRIGYTAEDTYFNAGILLLDLEKMRQRNLSQVLIGKAEEWQDRLFYADQDLLNFYFKDEVVYLPEKYNFGMARLCAYQEGEDISIAHFNGPEKPWRDLTGLDKRIRSFVARYQAIVRDYHRLASRQETVVSLVVATSGDSPHIYQCLSSIMRQTYANLDIVVLAKDLSCSVRKGILELQGYDERIRLVEAEGLNPLQAAYLTARGDYMAMVLADDFLEVAFVADLLAMAEQEQADMVISDYYSLDVERGIFLFQPHSDGTTHYLTSRDAIARQWDPLFAGLWGKMIHRDLLDRVPQGTVPELTQARQLYSLSQKIVYRQESYFCHRTQLPNSQPADLLGHYQGKIAELESLLADYHMLGLDMGWVVDRLRETLSTAQQELADQHPQFSQYLQTKLQLIEE